MKKTKEVSKLAGVSRRTLQYYDQEGLLSIKRDEQNHRLYDQQSLQHIWEILLYKEMGFELEEIKTILHLSSEKKNQCLDKKIEKILLEIHDMRSRIALIQQIRDEGVIKIPENADATYLEMVRSIREAIKTKDMIRDVNTTIEKERNEDNQSTI